MPYQQTLDYVENACQGQDASLLQKFAIYDSKVFYSIGP
jgi:hypothetical protein